MIIYFWANYFSLKTKINQTVTALTREYHAYFYTKYTIFSRSFMRLPWLIFTQVSYFLTRMSHWVVSNNAGFLNNKKSKTLSEYPDVISPEEIKEILRISTSGVYHLLQAGTIKSIVRRDVNKLTRHRLQSVLHDRIQKPRGCSVIQKLRRFGCLHFNDNARNWMPLIRADFCTGGVEWITSLLVLSDYLLMVQPYIAVHRKNDIRVTFKDGTEIKA